MRMPLLNTFQKPTAVSGLRKVPPVSRCCRTPLGCLWRAGNFGRCNRRSRGRAPRSSSLSDDSAKHADHSPLRSRRKAFQRRCCTCRCVRAERRYLELPFHAVIIELSACVSVYGDLKRKIRVFGWFSGHLYSHETLQLVGEVERSPDVWIKANNANKLSHGTRCCLEEM